MEAGMSCDLPVDSVAGDRVDGDSTVMVVFHRSPSRVRSQR
jgi:hypothetical protein